MLRTAHDALRRGDTEGAGRLLTPLLAAHPKRPDVLHLQGLIQQRSGDLAAARETLTRAADLGGGSPEIGNSLGNLLEDMGRLEEADRQFAALTEAHPSYLAAWINRGRLASKRGLHETAIATLQRACSLDPRSKLALITLGNALRRAGKADEAVAMLRKAVALDPGGSTRSHLAFALREAERARESVAEYDAAERAGYRTPQLLENRAAAWLDLEETERARADLDRVVAEFPAYLAGHRARARLYWEWGLEGDPFESYRRLAQAYPTEPSVWSAWINCLLSFRQYGAAAEVAEKAESALGETAVITATKAIAFSESGRISEAGHAFEKSLGAFQGQPEFLNALARHLLKSGSPERAAEIAERSVSLAPNNQFGWAYLGTAWRMTGDVREFWLHDYDGHVASVETRPPGWTGSAEEFAEHVAPALRALHVTKVHPAEQSLRNGTQTVGSLFSRREPAIRQIREAVTAAAESFAVTLPDDPNHPLLRRKAGAVDFTGSWSVRLTRHGYHINHVHERGWLSSAFYFALPPPDAADPPHAGWLQLGAPPDEMELGLPPRRLVEPKVGTLVLFPSSMWHGTVPFTAEGERLTAAFDIVPAVEEKG